MACGKNAVLLLINWGREEAKKMMFLGFKKTILLEFSGLARSTYYYHLKQQNKLDKNKALKAKI